jgi:hypothetical protein
LKNPHGGLPERRCDAVHGIHAERDVTRRNSLD